MLVQSRTFQWKNYASNQAKLQALKLHFFIKDEAGRKNSTVTHGEITGKVSGSSLAGYETVASPKNKIAKLLKDNQFQRKRGRPIKKKVEPVKETKLEPEPEIEIIF